jgi:hypothetical protein
MMNECPHCGGKSGSHMRWCSSDGPLYPSRTCEAVRKKLARAEAELAAAREALEFYANEENWSSRVVFHGSKSYSMARESYAVQDEGEIARAALSAGETA